MENNNHWLKDLLAEGKELKKRMSRLILELARFSKEHDEWLRKHEVRLTEH